MVIMTKAIDDAANDGVRMWVLQTGLIEVRP
jgi:hypothetical protein